MIDRRISDRRTNDRRVIYFQYNNPSDFVYAINNNDDDKISWKEKLKYKYKYISSEKMTKQFSLACGIVLTILFGIFYLLKFII